MRNHFALDRVLTTVDAVAGRRTLERHEESLRQVAAADRLIVTKTDLVEEPARAALTERLLALNPAARVYEAVQGEIEPGLLFDPLERVTAEPQARQPKGAHRHGGVRAFSLTFAQPLDWTAFGVWLTMLLQCRGRELLRLKGLLDTGARGPVLVNGVQHVIYPPTHLPAWPDEDRRSRLVFIANGMEPQAVETSLLAFARQTERR